jgi:hypothetical protein
MAGPWSYVAAWTCAAAATLVSANLMSEAERLRWTREQELDAQEPDAQEPDAEIPAPGRRGRVREELCLNCMQGCSAADGLYCNGDGHHFICSPCFQRHVQRCCSPARSAAFERLGCRIYCPGRRCSAAPSEAANADLAFTDRQIIRHVDDRTWQMLLRARQDAAQRRGLRALAQPAVAQQEPAAAAGL